MAKLDYTPALRFERLTPLFDHVAAVFVRDKALKRRVLSHARLAEGERVLDVGCGTGTLAILAAQAAPGVRVTGLDADGSILARARRKAADAGLSDIVFDEGTAAALPYPDASFDVVLSTLMLHHLPDDAKRATAAEFVRVLRPGGRLVVGDLGRPQDRLMWLAVRGPMLLDGTATTSLNVRGDLPDVLGDAGVQAVAVRDRMRTPSGTCDVITGGV